MSRFSPSDAALEGFRLTRERPLAVLVWAVARLVYGVASILLLVGISGPAMKQLMAMETSASPPTPDQVMPLTSQLAPAGVAILIISLLFYAVVYTAVLRAILRPADKAFAYLRLSIDELRQFALGLIIFALCFIYAIVVEIVSVVLVMAAQQLGPAALPVQILVIMAVVAAFVYPAVRLSVAPAMTFADGRISLLRALPISKGQFWPMFGAYVLALVLTLVVGLLAIVIFTFAVGAVGMAQGGVNALPALVGMMKSSDMSLSALFSPLRLANLVFGSLLATLAYLIMFAPAAAIFRDLTGRVGAPAHAPKPGLPWG